MTTTSKTLLAFISLIIQCNKVDARLLQTGANKINSRIINEMLIPRHSTTALMCEPIFTGTNSQAEWYHNGIVVANVSSNSNAVLHNHIYHAEESVPDVGFLIITNISLEDEGDYWCRRRDNKQEGEVARIIVAYVEKIPNDSRPVFYPSVPSIGQHVTANCPKANAVPSPTYTWFLNGEPVDLSTKRIAQHSNGSLRIQRFLRRDIGVYECVITNFAGRTSAKTYVNVVNLANNDVFEGTVLNRTCQSIMRSGLLWFLIGCLVTSSAVLSYLMCALFMVRPSHENRISLYSGLTFRVHPNLAPGFRKVIAPLPDMRHSERSEDALEQEIN